MSRVERYWGELLDSNDQLIDKLRVTGGKVSLNVNATIRGGGSVSVIGESDVNWLNTRVRIWHETRGRDPFALGTFMPTFPSFDNGSTLQEQTVELHDKTQILVEDKTTATFSVPEGAIVTDVIRSIIESAGESTMSITDSTATIATARTWDVDTTKLRIINDLLDYINYFSLWTDGMGVFQAVPYSRPAARPVARRFVRGERGVVHSPKWTRNQDIAEVPNRVVLKTEGGDDDEALVSVAENTDPASPFSYQGRGNRWIQSTYTSEAADQATLDDLARRRLISLSSPSATLDVDHLVVPLQLNDVVRFVSSNIDTLAVVERMDYTMKPGALVSATWREVQDL